ncbi:MAG: DUF885 domain-containing protein [Bergeyella sp.]|nr:DUF885 domain-containing protein [Bergeyella sp.]
MQLRSLVALVFVVLWVLSCKKNDRPMPKKQPTDIDSIAVLYFEEYLKLYPLQATQIGDNRYNDQLPIDIDKNFIKGELSFYKKIEGQLEQVNYSDLSDEKKRVYDVLSFQVKNRITELGFETEYIPFDQFRGLPLFFPIMGSGKGAQPFRTEADYDNWLKRVDQFPLWMGAAINNFGEGIKRGYVLPRKLVIKMIPQMRAEQILTPNFEENIFYGPVRDFPKSFSQEKKEIYRKRFEEAINKKIIPSYKKMGEFLEREYYPKARKTDGINALPDGEKIYKFYVKNWTTTDMDVEEVYRIGVSEVERIRAEMEEIKKTVGFTGALEEFFVSLKEDPKAMPYASEKEVLEAFRRIQNKIEPRLKYLFTKKPVTPFEIRRTEKYREASASAEYMPGTPDGKRPGIFYIPLPNPSKFNISTGMESLFLHEAIPGHHYQISLSQENTSLPKFMRFSEFGAFVEGWAHYCEFLGDELGLYKDPYQKMGALNDQMLRAVRLVVDVGLHTGKFTREEAIAYYMKNRPEDLPDVVSAIERYMAFPAQALSYKIGQLKFSELRARYEMQLGRKFNLARFHDELLNDGSLPLSVLDKKMEAWAKRQQ